MKRSKRPKVYFINPRTCYGCKWLNHDRAVCEFDNKENADDEIFWDKHQPIGKCPFVK